MLKQFPGFLIVVPLLAMVATPLAAQSRCDCTMVKGGCRAQIHARGKWLTYRSSSRACSRIDYYINGQPGVRTITGGRDRAEWLGPSRIKRILVESCRICQDRRVHGAARSITGTWSVFVRCSYGSGRSNATFNQGRSGAITGSSRGRISGRISGNRIAYTERYGAGTSHPNTVRYQGTVSGDGRSMSGTYTQRLHNGTCTWRATKVSN